MGTPNKLYLIKIPCDLRNNNLIFDEVLLLIKPNIRMPEVIASDLYLDEAKMKIFENLIQASLHQLEGIPVTIKELPLYIRFKYKSETFEKLLNGSITL